MSFGELPKGLTPTFVIPTTLSLSSEHEAGAEPSILVESTYSVETSSEPAPTDMAVAGSSRWSKHTDWSFHVRDDTCASSPTDMPVPTVLPPSTSPVSPYAAVQRVRMLERRRGFSPWDTPISPVMTRKKLLAARAKAEAERLLLSPTSYAGAVSPVGAPSDGDGDTDVNIESASPVLSVLCSPTSPANAPHHPLTHTLSPTLSVPHTERARHGQRPASPFPPFSPTESADD